MNSSAALDQNLLVELLSFGEDQKEQLETSLDVKLWSESYAASTQNMQPTFGEAISATKLSTEPEQQQQQQQQQLVRSSICDPKSSPRSVDRAAFKDHEVSKKRKMLPKWSCQVRMNPGAEVPLDDGHSWRKYGQKDILGAKYPRGYYRCTHRNAQGCLATKQVQRCDSDPHLFDVTYRGEHTCFHVPRSATPAPSARQSTSAQQKQRNIEEHHQKFRSSSSFSSVETEGFVVNDHNEHAATASLGCFLPRSSFPSSSSSFCSAPDEFAELMCAVNSGADLPPVVDMDFMLQTAHGFDLFDPDSFFPLH